MHLALYPLRPLTENSADTPSRWHQKLADTLETIDSLQKTCAAPGDFSDSDSSGTGATAQRPNWTGEVEKGRSSRGSVFRVLRNLQTKEGTRRMRLPKRRQSF